MPLRQPLDVGRRTRASNAPRRVVGKLTPPHQRYARGVALPRWPFALVFLAYPIWWVLGIGDFAFPVFGAVMVFYLIRSGRVEVPRGFGVWLLFLLWMACSVIEIDTAERLLGFIYRALLYLSFTAIFLYVYNARAAITARYAAGVLTGFWLIMIVGGYVGILFPLLSVTTPLVYVIPEQLQASELVGEMVIRRVTQFNPDSVLALDPRPSAPFIYTNGWGNAYSLLMPIVVAYLVEVRRERKFWWLLAAIPVSLVPAFLTLNRGMFLGLGLAAAYLIFRLVVRGNLRALVGVVAGLVVVGVAFSVLPVQERITARVEASSSNEDRTSLYAEAFERTLESPVFGYGAPRPSETGPDSVGTQGQFWMVLFSHGFLGVAFFMGWLFFCYFRSVRRRDPVGMAGNTVLLVVLVEVFYYGMMTSGFAIAMIAAALVLRPEPNDTDGGRENPLKTSLRSKNQGALAMKMPNGSRPSATARAVTTE